MYSQRTQKLFKSFVAAHQRRLKSGKVINIPAHYDKRQRKDAQAVQVDHAAVQITDPAQKQLWLRMHQEQHVLHHVDKAKHETDLEKISEKQKLHEGLANYHTAERDKARESGDVSAYAHHNAHLTKSRNKLLALHSKQLVTERKLAKVHDKLAGIHAMKEGILAGSGAVHHVSDKKDSLKEKIASDLANLNNELKLAKEQWSNAERDFYSSSSKDEFEEKRSRLQEATKKLDETKNKISRLERAKKLADKKVISVGGMGEVLTEDGVNPKKFISRYDAEQVMQDLGITGKLAVRGMSKFIVVDKASDVDRTLVATKKESEKVAKELPMSSHIRKTDDGRFIVKIPFALKDKFKSEFSSAMLEKDESGKHAGWSVGSRSSAKLNAWVKEHEAAINEHHQKEAEKATKTEKVDVPASIKEEFNKKFNPKWGGESNPNYLVSKDQLEEARVFLKEKTGKSERTARITVPYELKDKFKEKFTHKWESGSNWLVSPEDLDDAKKFVEENKPSASTPTSISTTRPKTKPYGMATSYEDSEDGTYWDAKRGVVVYG